MKFVILKQIIVSENPYKSAKEGTQIWTKVYKEANSLYWFVLIESKGWHCNF